MFQPGRKSTNHRRHRSRPLSGERLEARKLMDGVGFGPRTVINEQSSPLEIWSHQRIEVTLRDAYANGPAVEVDAVRYNQDGSVFGSSKFLHRNFRSIQFRGSQWNDVLINESSHQVIADGRGGDDTLIGGRKVDILYGGSGNDRIDGRGGDDRIKGGLGADTLIGGEGNDRIDAVDQSAHDTIDARLGSDRVSRDRGDTIKLPAPARVTVRGGAADEGDKVRFTIDVQAGEDVSKHVRVHYRTESLTARGSSGATIYGPMRAGQDFSTRSGVLIFSGRGGSKDVFVNTYTDTLVEGSEEFQLVITKVENGIVTGATSAIGTIRDKTIPDSENPGGPEEPEPPTPNSASVSFLDITQSASEGNSGVKKIGVRVQPNGSSNGRVTVRVRTIDSGIRGSATPGVDYMPLDQELSWQPGQSQTQTVWVEVVGDRQVERSRESIRLKLEPIENATVDKAQSVVWIHEDDSAAPPVPTSLSFEHIRELEGSSGNRVAVATIRISNPSNYPVPIQYSTLTGNGFGNAIEGEDFQSLHDQIVVIQPGETEASIEVLINGDNLVEHDEYFHLRLDAPDWVHIPNPNLGITLVNDDQALTGSEVATFINGTWWIDGGNGSSAERSVQFGLAGDTPLTGDYNGDGTLDLVAVRDNTVTGMLDWYFDYSADGTLDKTLHYGLIGDEPVAGDFNGDGIFEATVVRPNHWTGGLDWYVDLDRDGYAAEQVTRFGNIGDLVVPGDFDGNGRTDFGVARKEGQFLRWYIDTAGDGVFAEHDAVFGLATDDPLVGDWDGDGDDDFAVARKLPQPAVVDILFDLDDGDDRLEERRLRFDWGDADFFSM